MKKRLFFAIETDEYWCGIYVNGELIDVSEYIWIISENLAEALDLEVDQQEVDMEWFASINGEFPSCLDEVVFKKWWTFNV